MQSRSVKCSFRRFAESGVVLAFFFALPPLFATNSHAATVTPENPYVADVTDPPVVHYAKTPTTGVFMEEGYQALDLSKSWTNYAADTTNSAGIKYPNLMRFNVHTTATVGTGDTVGTRGAVSVLLQTGSTNIIYVPIAYAKVVTADTESDQDICVNDVNCRAPIGGAIANSDNISLLSSALYHTGDTLQIGIYPSDICAAYYVQSSNGTAPAITACNGTSVATITATVIPTFSLKFIFGTENSVGRVDSTATETATIVAQIHNAVSTYSCPSPFPDDLYFPGDGQIFLRSNFLTVPTAAQVTALGAPPLRSLVAVGAIGGVDTTTSPLSRAVNPIQGRIALGASSQTINDFTNTTTGSDNIYTMGFSVLDAAGQVPAFGAGCTLTGVQTVDVKGFLNSSKCFIATAAYRSTSAAPVMMLREFRDQILERFELGRLFVGWYYSWSPDAAEWLLAHPQFRYPVLIVLVPVELIAWMALHPMALLPLVFGSLALLLHFRSRRVFAREVR